MPRTPRRDSWWTDAIRAAVAATDPGTGKRKLRAIAEKVAELALAGDMQAIREIGNRLDGKPRQSTEITLRGEICDLTDAELAEIVRAGNSGRRRSGSGTDTSAHGPDGPDSVH